MLFATGRVISADSKKGPAITGREVLLEAVDKNGQLGIYAFDVFDTKTPQPRLLVKGGSSPKWSLHHRKFFFAKQQTLAIYELNGDQKAWWAKVISTGFEEYANSALFEQGRMEWDLSGKAQYIENRPEFGAVLSRSTSLSEKRPLPHENPAMSGFLDTVIPLIDGVPQSIGNASVSPDEKLLAAQVYPALPYNLGGEKSRIRLYELFYHRSKTNMPEWEKMIEENRKHFVIDSLSPQVVGPGREIASPPADCIDIEPRFSPSGKYIAFNRINTREKSVRPMLVETARPEMARPLENPVWGDQPIIGREPVWGKPHHRAIKWDSEKDQLWIVAADNAKISKLNLPEGTWHWTNIASQTYFARPPIAYAFHQDYVVGVWAGWPQQIQLFKVDRNDDSQYFPKPVLSVPLPEGFTVRRVEW